MFSDAGIAIGTETSGKTKLKIGISSMEAIKNDQRRWTVCTWECLVRRTTARAASINRARRKTMRVFDVLSIKIAVIRLLNSANFELAISASSS